MIDLGISIINYKTKELTAQCLKSIFDKNWNIKYKVFLVDNNSQDGSLKFLKEKFPLAHFQENNENLGFAGGHDSILPKIEARYILVLNSDTKINSGVLDKMVEFMDQKPAMGIASCKIFDFEGKLQPNAGNLPYGLALITWLFNLEPLGLKRQSFHIEDSKFYEDFHLVGWVSGSFLLIKKEVVDKVGYFDRNYFMYFEDVDLCDRVAKAGFEIGINPNVSVDHLSGGSSDNPKLRQWLGESRGLVTFCRLRFNKLFSFLIKLLVYKATFLRMIAFALVGKFNYAKTYAKVFISL
ncbi:glycosyltransferase family 2 protein [Candidatus Daviesbacteria bacterium]|nr:glycosyltransferase family 2 protein [Candidatus Daviesbacteria bacterium]